MIVNSKNEALTLVIMAAGLGNRFGGDKQLAAFGPNGETMLELSILSASRAGFLSVVLIIRPELEQALETIFLTRLKDKLPTNFRYQYCYQAMDDLPVAALEACIDVSHRVKPWGTAHALWCARDKVNGNMAVINADDYYGDTAFELLVAGLSESELDWMLVAYPLSLTLSDHGGVNRGVCLVENERLLHVTEWTNIRQDELGLIGSFNGKEGVLPSSVPVSMTCWGFTPDIFLAIEAKLTQFVTSQGTEPKSECFLPDVVQQAMVEGADGNVLNQKIIRVKTAQEPWFGVTYAQDAAWVRQQLSERLDNKYKEITRD
ncbi:NTP transferase domain-containing protein [Shewanella sp. VB17]|uniref:NTP transferase domain-containing protein n=1 Tax=Shewanella sp. VB17 TaxID=2739432 RepID=UPI001567C624|nr:NTP transferase domain-containing protein [Shewanella sp. VB17]NRD72227.1 NTP transferase domain-containing protein [Shewanella sp. VB17]